MGDQLATKATNPSLVINAALALMLAALWASTHHFQIFARDGVLYALQAMARLNPTLTQDVYFANTSQDQFTIFSRLYAATIQWLGLANAALLLYLICVVTFTTAAWAAARGLVGSNLAWLAALMLIVTTGSYGASWVFNYSENYLSARSLAEALVAVALAAHVYGWRRCALIVAVAAMAVHPLMALPGLILLVLLWLPTRYALVSVTFGCLATLAIALTAVSLNSPPRFLALMDARWLEVVRERSQFLFLKYWNLKDWELHLRSFLSLALSFMVFNDMRVRRLCLGAILVGASGLVVALVAGSIGPVAILLQGQAWRWFWVTGFVAVLLLGPTAVQAWRNEKCGPICAVLVMGGWIFPVVDGNAQIAFAVLLWTLQSKIDLRTGQLLRWAGYAVVAIMAIWGLANSWSVATSPPVVTGLESPFMDHIRSVLTLQLCGVAVFGIFWFFIRSRQTVATPLLACVLLVGSLIFVLPPAVEMNQQGGMPAEIASFADWRKATSVPGSVLLVSSDKWVTFIWFTLEKPSYISTSQSAGVVFSRDTALEIKRRSEVLLPLMKPDWKVLTGNNENARGKKPERVRPLTAETLAAVCADPELSFVVAKENVGYDPLRHTNADAWKDWNLYDCRHVRSTGTKA